MLTKNRELQEIIEGLSEEQKQISPKYFYDERGSQLFDEITRLPEYYLTDTEIGIMRDHIDEMVALMDFYRERPSARREMALRARKRVLGEHTYQHRLELIGEKPAAAAAAAAPAAAKPAAKKGKAPASIAEDLRQWQPADCGCPFGPAFRRRRSGAPPRFALRPYPRQPQPVLG